MLEVISKNPFAREVLEYTARCAVAAGVAVISSSVQKKQKKLGKKRQSNSLQISLF